MKKSLKVLIMIALLLLLLPLLYTLIGTQAWGQLPFRLLPMASYPLIGSYLDQMLFWLTLAFMVFVILLMLVIAFYPKAHSELAIDQEAGSLTVQKKAIESYVLEAVKEEPFIADPAVKVRITKNKVKVEVKGKLRKVFQVTDKQERLAEKIKTDITKLLGDNSQVTTNVVFKDYRTEKRNNVAARVQ